MPLNEISPPPLEAGDKAVLAFRVPGLLQTLDVTAGRRYQKAKNRMLSTLMSISY